MAQTKIKPKKVTLNQLKNNWTYLATGESGSLDLEKAWLRNAQHVFKVFCEKQHDYGPDNIAVGGLKGLALRIGDKIARLWNLTGLSDGQEKETAVIDEDPIKTLEDVADYGIIGMMIVDGSWPKKDVNDAFGLSAVKKILTDLSKN